MTTSLRIQSRGEVGGETAKPLHVILHEITSWYLAKLEANNNIHIKKKHPLPNALHIRQRRKEKKSLHPNKERRKPIKMWRGR